MVLRFANMLLIFYIVAFTVTTSYADGKVLFKADFEEGIKAYGADPPEPVDAAGGGYEVTEKGNHVYGNTAIEHAFPAQGKSCFRLGTYAVWHTGISDIKGRLSLWFMPMSLPPKDQEQEIIWGGDASKPYQTLSIKINHSGQVFFNYYSWQKNQSWLSGILSRNSIKPRKWNHLMLTWGDSGQRIYINGKLDISNSEKYPLSWLFDIKFGGTACYLDDIELSDSEEPVGAKPVSSIWRPTTKLQKDLVDVEKGATALIRKAPEGSDAYCRGLVIDYISKSCWAGVLQSPPTALAVDNVEWMHNAILSTKPVLKTWERAVPKFNAAKKIDIKHGRIIQNGQPTFLIGMYTPSPIDNAIGFNFSNALMPGPGYTFLTPKDIGDTGKELGKNLTEQQKKNKVTDILLSLNIPDWLYKSDQLVREGGCGWFNYNNEAASVRKAFKDTADIVMPNIKDSTINLIVNLANEPANSGYCPTTTGPKWRAWLKSKHGSINNLNDAWNTSYTDFDSVKGPVNVKSSYVDCADPGGLDIPTDPLVLGQWYDWCLFNQERYADFFSELKNNISKYRPDTMFNIKWLSNFSGWWKSIGYALNPYGVSKICDFAGCDAWTIYAGQDPDSYWGVWWDDMARTYDLLKSIAPEKPVINSENHILRGNDPNVPQLKYGEYFDVIPWQFFYTAVWQQAVHGQCAGEYWTYWESGKGYNLNERAKSMDAISQAVRDLKRNAVGITAMANKMPKVAILLSSAALAWSPKEHVNSEMQVYKALNLSGINTGFMLEEMIPDNALCRYKMLIIPQAVHISRAMKAAIDGFISNGNTVLVIGDLPSADEYNRPFVFNSRAVVWPEFKPVVSNTNGFDSAHPGALSPEDSSVRKMQQKISRFIHQKGLAPEVTLKENGNLPFGIEWRSIVTNKKLLLNICNYTNRPHLLNIDIKGKSIRGKDLLNGRSVNGRVRLLPLEVMFIQCSVKR